MSPVRVQEQSDGHLAVYCIACGSNRHPELVGIYRPAAARLTIRSHLAAHGR